MQRWMIVGAASLVLAGVTSAAQAADWYTGAQPEGPAEDWIVAVDAGGTVTSQGSRFAHVTVTGAATGTLLTSGPRVRVEGLAGEYGLHDSGARGRRGEEAAGSGLLGYEAVWRDASLAGYLGLTGRSDTLPRSGPVTARTEDRLGLKAALELYARPSPDTLVQAHASYATPHSAYFARLRGGFALFGLGYVGPEVAVLGDDLFRQWRVGAHLTGFQIGALQFGLSAGYARDRALGGGLYTSLDVRAVF